MKPITFTIGLAWLIYGALFFGYGDWDIGVSLVMACSTYLCADWCWISFKNLLSVKIDYTPVDEFMLIFSKAMAALIATWWCVDGSYWAYWSIVNPDAMFREGQWPMSLCLFLLCGFIWSTKLNDWLTWFVPSVKRSDKAI